jgi:hypothetical protein
MYKLLIEWLRIKLNIPYEEPIRVCETCEVLKLELAQSHLINKDLLDKLINPSRIEESKPDTSNLKPILPHRSNWQTERMRLERLDAINNDKLLKEKALKAAGHPDSVKENQKREEATNIAAPSNEIIGNKKSIEELEKDFTVEFSSKVVGE